MRKPAPAAELAAAIRQLTTRRREKRKAAATDVVLRQYNEALIRKLEERNVQLHEEARKLASSEEQFRQLTESIEEVFFMTTAAADEMLYVSPAYEKIWGRTCASLYASPRDWADAIHPEDRERSLDVALNSGASGEAYELEYRIVRPDGGHRWIIVRGFPVKDPAGRVYRIAGTAADITEQKRLKDQFLQAQKMEAVGRLAGGVAHDFNNLLSVILGLSEMSLETLPPDDPLRADLAEIHATGQRAAQLTRQLLAFSRRQVFEPRLMDINLIVEKVERMLARVIGEDVKLNLERALSLPVVRVDPGQIEQVLMNLCVNARDAMPKGGTLTVRTAALRLDKPYAKPQGEIPAGAYVTLTVSDTGAGMGEAVKEHLFEPFFTTKPAGKGTGLGLATCYGIVKQSGGFIRVESREGEGSAFTAYFPAVDAAAAPEAQEEPHGDGRGCETVLVVEDDPVLRKLARRILAEKGYAALEGSDGLDGLKLIRADSAKAIRLVITDVVMPVMNGRTFVEELKRMRPDVKILFTSGYPDETLSHEGVLDAGLNFIRKPYSGAALSAKVRQVLDKM